MAQILQDLKPGDTLVENVPVPLVRAGHLLIRTRSSLVSASTMFVRRVIVIWLLDRMFQSAALVRKVVQKTA